jgi:2-dehydro-3-deoxyphosphogluconate aldolase/(4S)-4-hydroxy-2-oxoglutarate aldolase
MTRPRAAILATFEQHRCSAILRTNRPEAVRPALQAAIAGGFHIVEVTLTTPEAIAHVRWLAQQPGVCAGAGTVLTVDEAKAAVAAGAEFLVSPVTDPEVIGWCREHGVLSVPGTYTPTEMLAAHRAGADVVKLFPAAPGGPEYVKAVLNPMPFLKVFPTAGITTENAAAFLAAGAFGVGFVGTLFDAQDLAAARFAAVEQRARQMVAAVQATARPAAS